MSAVCDAPGEVVAGADVAGLHGVVLRGVDGGQSLEDGVVGRRRVEAVGLMLAGVVEGVGGHHGSTMLKYKSVSLVTGDKHPQ